MFVVPIELNKIPVEMYTEDCSTISGTVSISSVYLLTKHLFNTPSKQCYKYALFIKQNILYIFFTTFTLNS